MNRGQWYDFVVHYKYSYNGDGLIEVYGAPAGSYNYYKDHWTKLFQWREWSISYRFIWSRNDFTAYIDYDAVRVGTSLNEVKPR